MSWQTKDGGSFHFGRAAKPKFRQAELAAADLRKRIDADRIERQLLRELNEVWDEKPPQIRATS